MSALKDNAIVLLAKEKKKNINNEIYIYTDELGWIKKNPGTFFVFQFLNYLITDTKTSSGETLLNSVKINCYESKVGKLVNVYECYKVKGLINEDSKDTDLINFSYDDKNVKIYPRFINDTISISDIKNVFVKEEFLNYI